MINEKFIFLFLIYMVALKRAFWFKNTMLKFTLR